MIPPMDLSKDNLSALRSRAKWQIGTVSCLVESIRQQMSDKDAIYARIDPEAFARFSIRNLNGP